MIQKTSSRSTGNRAAAARDSLPGQRDALKPGALGGVPVDPQGDENRDPPPGAPSTPPGIGQSASSAPVTEPSAAPAPEQSATPGDTTAGYGPLHEVRATFTDSAHMQDAVSKLEMSGFNRADLSLPEANPPIERKTPESGAKAVDTDDDARQARTVQSSTAASAAAMGAAGIAVASGGALLPVVAVAVAAGAVIGGATFSISKAASNTEQHDRDVKAEHGTLILSVRAPTEEMRAHAETLLRSAGGQDLQFS